MSLLQVGLVDKTGKINSQLMEATASALNIQVTRDLPQFWNVLQGTMSLVGPRPIVAAEVEKYGEYFEEYCKVKPGLTGLWQVSGRNEVSYEERVQLDCRYVRSWSLLGDAKIMSRTLSSVVNQDGAY